MHEPVKVLFRFHSDVLEEETVETIWATPVDKEKGHYKIDNIPFYVTDLATGDIVLAEYDDMEGQLTFRDTVGYSGNSTIQVVVMDKTREMADIRQQFRNMGCASRVVGSGYFVMDIPATLDYKLVKQQLDALTAAGVLDYAEACLSDEHRF